jgi:DNA polymerase-3 subunit chi
VVCCGSDASVAALDKALWECNNPDWLPHGTAADGDPDLQPIWLATDDAAPNGARFLFLVDGTTSDRLAGFDRVFDLFGGNSPDSVAAARLRWKAAKSAGHALTYWQQSNGRWEKKG